MKKAMSFLLVTMLLASCQSYDHGHGLSALGGTTAAALAWKLTEGKSQGERLAWTAASGLGAYTLGQHVRQKVIESEKEHYKMGYESGLGDASRKQYEIIQNRQKEDSNTYRPRFSVYEFPGVTKRDEVNFVPHTVKLRIQED